MSNTPTWRITDMQRELSDGYVYHVDFVCEIEWQTGYFYMHSDAVDLDRPDTLVAYDDLDHDTVVGWIKSKLGTEKVTEIETKVNAECAELQNPTKASGTPW